MLSSEEIKFKNTCFDALRMAFPDNSPQSRAQYTALYSFVQDKLNGSKTELTLNKNAETLIQSNIFSSVPEHLKHRIKNGEIFSHQQILMKLIFYKAYEACPRDIMAKANLITKTKPSSNQILKDFFQIKVTKAASCALHSKIAKIAISAILALGAFAVIYLLHSMMLASCKYLITKHIAPFAKAKLPESVISVINKISSIMQKIFQNLLLTFALAMGWDFIAKNYIAKTKLGAKILKVFNTQVMSFVFTLGHPVSFSLNCVLKMHSFKPRLDAAIDKYAQHLLNIHHKLSLARRSQQLAQIETIWNSIFEKSKQKAQVNVA